MRQYGLKTLTVIVVANNISKCIIMNKDVAEKLRMVNGVGNINLETFYVIDSYNEKANPWL